MKKLLYWIPAVAMMILIFNFSRENGSQSSALSHGVGYHLVEFADRIFHLEVTPDRYTEVAGSIEVFIRKAAHFTEYMLLSVSIGFGLYKSKRITGRKLFMLMELFTVMYACSDEFHQLFVPGREGKLFDVMIDGLGALTGVILVFFVLYAANRRHRA